MPQRNRFTLALAVTAALAAPLATGCSDGAPTDDPRDAQVAELTRSVEDLTAANDALSQELKRQGRQISGLSRVRMARSAMAATDPATGADMEEDDTGGMEEVDVEAPTLAAGDDPVADAAIAALLKTESGRKAIQEATSQEIARREQKDRRLYVSYQVGAFARQAGLDERQTEQLQSIWKTSMDGGVELRKEFAAIATLPEAEREAARAKAMESMRNLGRERRESVGEILTTDQLVEYEKAEEEIVGGLHGGPRR